jgi:uncharacterized membrane protein YkvA (DUF1232 family)
MVKLKAWARGVLRDVLAVYLAMKDPLTPWFVRILAGLVACYALSPIDLIPDFIPVLGYLDDLILVPLGIALVVRLMPKPLMSELRAEAEVRFADRRPRVLAAGIVVATIWAALTVWVVLTVFDPFSGQGAPGDGGTRRGVRPGEIG